MYGSRLRADDKRKVGYKSTSFFEDLSLPFIEVATHLVYTCFIAVKVTLLRPY